MTHTLSIEIAGQTIEVSLETLDEGRVRLTWGGRTRVLDVKAIAREGRSATYSVVAEGGGAQTLVDVDGAAPDLVVTCRNMSLPAKVQDARRRRAALAARRESAEGPAAVKSPMPGKVVKVMVQNGDLVQAGQGVVVVEAMKMENELRAPREGRITDVRVREGQAVEGGAELVRIGPAS